MADENDYRRVGPLRMVWDFTLADIATLVAAFVSVGLMYTNLREGYQDHETRLRHHDKEIIELKRSDERQRDEIRSDLKAINDKLDKLVDRQLDRNK